MIGGFPLRQEDSFFHFAVERLRKQTAHNLISSVFTFGGFPITRVPKHLKARCLDAHPNIVVLQFASTDLIVPIRKKRNHHGSLPVQRKVLANPPTLLHWLKWRCRGLLADTMRLPPVTAPTTYVETMDQIARTLLNHQVIPVVMSPFVFGGQRSNRFARACTDRLQQSMNALPGTVYVDAYSALDQFPRRRVLLCDGTHLSVEGHQVVADALFPCLKNVVDNQAWLPKN